MRLLLCEKIDGFPVEIFVVSLESIHYFGSCKIFLAFQGLSSVINLKCRVAADYHSKLIYFDFNRKNIFGYHMTMLFVLQILTLVFIYQCLVSVEYQDRI